MALTGAAVIGKMFAAEVLGRMAEELQGQVQNFLEVLGHYFFRLGVIFWSSPPL